MMKLRLFRMGIVGKVAVANLWAVGIALLVGYLGRGSQSGGWATAADIAQIAVIVLSFPVGWIAILHPVGGPTIFDLVLLVTCLPLNAYFWGYAVATLEKRHKISKSHKTGVS